MSASSPGGEGEPASTQVTHLHQSLLSPGKGYSKKKKKPKKGSGSGSDVPPLNTLIAEIVAALVASVPVGPSVHHEHPILRAALDSQSDNYNQIRSSTDGAL